MRAMSSRARRPSRSRTTEDVAVAQEVEAGDEVRAIGGGAESVIFEHAHAAGGVERVELAVEDLSAFGGGDAGVTDEGHGVCSPEKPITPAPCRNETISGLSGRESRQSGAVGRLRAGRDKHVFVVDGIRDRS